MPSTPKAKTAALETWKADAARRIARSCIPKDVRTVFDLDDGECVALMAMHTASATSTDEAYLWTCGERAVIDAVRSALKVGRTYAEDCPPETRQKIRTARLPPFDPRYRSDPEEPDVTLPDTPDRRDPIAAALSRLRVEEILSALKPRTAEIVRAWSDGWTDREIAVAHGISHVRVIQLRTKAAERIALLMEEDE